jgi:hypothetical protein
MEEDAARRGLEVKIKNDQIGAELRVLRKTRK